MPTLADKVALITGGSSGIGLAIARTLLAEGASVCICGRDPARLERAVRELAAGDRLLSYPADVSDPGQVGQLVRHVLDRHDRVDILVNNAGLNIKKRRVRELTPESWRLLLAANSDSAFYCIHAVLPGMLQRRDGLIINISSIAGKRPGPLGGAGYAAAKFAMRALGTCLAAEEKDCGIRVCNIYPGEVNTPILDARPEPVSDWQKAKMLQPEDIAAAVRFIATLPPHVSVPELVIKPVEQNYV
jgi:NADP-dependent 3-hydroxy acid dehydrogenase YdfG